MLLTCSPRSENAPPVRAKVNCASPRVSFGLAMRLKGAGTIEATARVSAKSMFFRSAPPPPSRLSASPCPVVPDNQSGPGGSSPAFLS